MNEKEDLKNLPSLMDKTKMVPVPIPDEVLEAAASIAPEGFFASVTETGIYFKAFDYAVPFIAGRIVDIDPYLGKFENGILSKMSLSRQPYPEGYQPRMDIAIQDPEKISILSLAPTSAKAAASFLRHLKNLGHRPENCLVRVETAVRTSKQGGRFGVAVFSLIGTINPDPPQEPSIARAVADPVSPVPSAEPATVKNPWA